ncbi:hypothetical protein L1080_033515 [Rhodococcus sp. MSC1_016]|jgi:hypothetical protein|uniref:hypothetical protein n=1 Tax=Rhodococcus sp. MSC1_016 TaxID=2909266 RepID=UPI0020301E0E|nr:hypothetical protein [Rhodococcus sp. MSC1_016]
MSTRTRTATIAAVVATLTVLGTAVGAPIAGAAPVAHTAPVAAQGPGGAIIKSLQNVKWLKEIKNAAKDYVIMEVVEKAIELLLPKGGSSTVIPTVSPASINSPDSLVARSSNPAGIAPRVSYVKSDDPRGLFYSTLRGGPVNGSGNSYKVGIQSVKFTPGTSSTPPSITISNSAVTNKIFVLGI